MNDVTRRYGPLLAAIGMLPLLAPVALAQAIVSSHPVMVDRIERPNPEKRAKDLSGIACRVITEAGQDCLVVNDESRAAQRAVLADRILRGGAVIPLIGEAEPAPGFAAGASSAIGRCPDGALGRFDEFDGEGVTWLPGAGGAGAYYVVGSHACPRRHPERGLQPSTHLLARIAVDAEGRFAPAALSWRLGPSLRAEATVGPYYNRLLTDADRGLDIEGIAAIGGALLFGLRSPTLEVPGDPARHHAFILEAPAAALFDTAAPADTPVPLRLVRIALPPRTGIRDLAALPDGRLLILSGPARGDGGVFSLHLATPGAERDWPIRTLIAAIDGPPDAKAEGVAFLRLHEGDARVLILFEDPRDGAREYRLRL